MVISGMKTTKQHLHLEYENMSGLQKENLNFLSDLIHSGGNIYIR